MGTPSTGSTVCAAHTPAKCAAPPAAAMITRMPRSSAELMYSAVMAGVRWAELTLHSCGTANCPRVSEQAFIVPQSELLPMITATSGEDSAIQNSCGGASLPSAHGSTRHGVI